MKKLTIEFTDEEAVIITRLARDAGVSVSEYVRKASIREDKSSIDDAISKLEKTLGRKIYGR